MVKRSLDMKMTAQIIVGLGFGDEGKGLITDYYCSKISNSLVVRFNGGQQAGHTVWTKAGKRHVFSNFGSGSLRGVPTYWSKYCTFSPGLLLDEFFLLPVETKIFIDYQCPVTTHYDILYNRCLEHWRGDGRQGSCGLGFGATIERHKLMLPKFMAADLLKPAECKDKLAQIRSYYRDKIEKEIGIDFSKFNHDREDNIFMSDLAKIKFLIKSKSLLFIEGQMLFNKKAKRNYIFEGAQGILLDVDSGFKPYVTKSNTTTKNAMEILRNYFGDYEINIAVNYVTRVYQTRHGEGPFRQCKQPLKLKNTKFETNFYNKYQGDFRVSYLDVDKLNYALLCDSKYSIGTDKNLFITCGDQLVSPRLPVYINNRKKEIHYLQIPMMLNTDFKFVKYSFNKCSDFL